MFPRYRWQESDVAEAEVNQIAEELCLPLPIARILIARGIKTPRQITDFLNPDLMTQLGHPYLFPGAQAAAEKLWHAIHEKQDIVVYGDFDADGVAAAAVLTQALKRFGAQVETFLPLRDPEGYGLTLKALERCQCHRGNKWPDLLITVDCGITAVAEVAYLIEQGVEVIITDHHECGKELPKNVVIVNPKYATTPGAEALCGAGVAFKVVHAMAELSKTHTWYQGAPFCSELLTLVGLATVTDIVPLVGENRLFVATALRNWNHWAGEGLQALLARASIRLQAGAMDATLFGFVLGPRLNAAGRMGSAMTAYELLTTCSQQEAAELAAQLEKMNGERRGVESRMLAAALQQCGLDNTEVVFDQPAVVVASEGTHAGTTGWHPGVSGIVAARLSEQTARPAAVITLNEQGEGRGSVRAGTGYHALEALQAAQETLDGFGGHEHAAGFTVKPGCFERFRTLFCEACASQAQAGVDALELGVDGWLTADQVSLAFYAEQQKLAPFGHGNQMPRWGLRGVIIKQVRSVGASGDHLQFQFGLENGQCVRGIWFRQGAAIEELHAQAQSKVDLVCELHRSDFGSEPQAELRVVDLAVAAVCC